MKRKITYELDNWVTNPQRKPLLIRGARQVGKTWCVRDLATRRQLELIELNFERDPNLATLFNDNDPVKTLKKIEATYNITINPDRSLLFLDEIQSAPELLAKLRWFAEELPALPVITTGSLLDFVLAKHEFSMPVGRISYMHLEPMSFQEFLLAKQEQKLYEFLDDFQLGEEIPLLIHNRLWELTREYFIVGGMPAVLLSWVNNNSWQAVSNIQQDLLAAYRDDFTKYSGRIETSRLEEVLQAIPKQLGQKFKYVHVNPNIQSSSVKKALDLLIKSRLCCRVNWSAGNGVPLTAGEKDKMFKTVFLDTGLTSSLVGLLPQNMINTSNLVNNGRLTEQFVGQMLRTIQPNYMEPKLYYWAREKAGSAAEIDYLIQYDNDIIPIEVKAGSSGSLKSLHIFMAEKKLTTAIRVNSEPPSITAIKQLTLNKKPAHYTLISIPLYLTEQIPQLLAWRQAA